MRKSTWMAQLERALSREGMTGMEKRTVLNYYEEMYQDRLDDGAEEEAIIKEFGFPEDVAQSVRENDERSQKDERSRKDESSYKNERSYKDGSRKSEYAEPVEAYSANTAYDSAPGYFAPVNEPVKPQYGTPINTAPPVHNTPPINTAPPQQNNKNGAESVVKTIAYIILAIVLFSLGVGLGVGGIVVIIASFTVIAFSAGIWLIVFGVGLVLFAFGCLIFASAIKFTKSIGNSVSNGGAR